MKSIIVTGAAGNLGRATVARLVRDGYRVHAALGPGETAEAFQDLPQNDRIDARPVDLLDETAAGAWVRDLLAGDSDLQAAVLLVGGWAPGPLADTDAAALEKMFRLNFFTAFNIVRPLLKHFERRGGGQFILIGARAALRPDEGKKQAAYALSKSLLFRLAEIINEEGGPANVRATIVAPSALDTPQNRASMPDADPAKWVPLDAVADAIAFLLYGAGQNLRETVFKMYNRS